MLKYQLYDSRLPRHHRSGVSSTMSSSTQSVGIDSTFNSSGSAIRRQISKHPALALNVGIAAGFVLGWLVKR